MSGRRSRKARRSKSKPDPLRKAILAGLDMLIAIDWSRFMPPTPQGLSGKILGEGADPLILRIAGDIATASKGLGFGLACQPSRVAEALDEDIAKVVDAFMRMTAPDYGCFHLVIAIGDEVVDLVTARSVVGASSKLPDRFGWTFMPEPWFAFILGSMAFAADHKAPPTPPAPPAPVEIEGFRGDVIAGPSTDDSRVWLWRITSPLEQQDYEGWLTREQVTLLFEEIITDPNNWPKRDTPRPAPASVVRVPRIGSRRRALLDTLAQRKRPLPRASAKGIGGANGLTWLCNVGFAEQQGPGFVITDTGRAALSAAQEQA